MIQRVQSIYLLLAAAIIVICFFIPLIDIQISSSNIAVDVTNQRLFPYGVYNEGTLELNTWGIFVILIFSGILPLISIFSFKNRRTQKNLIIVSILFILFYYFTIYIYISSIYNEINNATVLNVGTFLPIVSLILLILAYNAVDRDDKKVRSLDRIR